MAKTKPLSLSDVHELIDRSAEFLDWTPKYVNLLSTTATGVFVAMGEPQSLRIDLDAAEGQIEAVRASLLERGKSPKTAETYASAWRRIAAIVEGWEQARADGVETKFWNTFDKNYRDPRLARRRIRRLRPAGQGVALAAPDPGRNSSEAPASKTYEVRLEHGVATLVLPDHFTSDDVVSIFDAVTRHRASQANDSR